MKRGASTYRLLRPFNHLRLRGGGRQIVAEFLHLYGQLGGDVQQWIRLVLGLARSARNPAGFVVHWAKDGLDAIREGSSPLQDGHSAAAPERGEEHPERSEDSPSRPRRHSRGGIGHGRGSRVRT